MIGDRIKLLITKYCDGNKSLFANKIGVTPSVIGNITGERNGNPSFEVLQKIINAFEEINPDWIINGVGPMLRVNNVQEYIIKKTDDFINDKYQEIKYKKKDNNSISNIYIDIIKSQEDKIQELNRIIGQLEFQLKLLKENKRDDTDVGDVRCADVG